MNITRAGTVVVLVLLVGAGAVLSQRRGRTTGVCRTCGSALSAGPGQAPDSLKQPLTQEPSCPPSDDSPQVPTTNPQKDERTIARVVLDVEAKVDALAREVRSIKEGTHGKTSDKPK